MVTMISNSQILREILRQAQDDGRGWLRMTYDGRLVHSEMKLA